MIIELKNVDTSKGQGGTIMSGAAARTGYFKKKQ